MSEVHDDAATVVIAAQLTRCTLGHHQPELRTDLTGVLARFVQLVQRDLVPALEKVERALRRAGERLADEAEAYLTDEDEPLWGEQA